MPMLSFLRNTTGMSTHPSHPTAQSVHYEYRPPHSWGICLHTFKIDMFHVGEKKKAMGHGFKRTWTNVLFLSLQLQKLEQSWWLSDPGPSPVRWCSQCLRYGYEHGCHFARFLEWSNMAQWWELNRRSLDAEQALNIVYMLHGMCLVLCLACNRGSKNVNLVFSLLLLQKSCDLLKVIYDSLDKGS